MQQRDSTNIVVSSQEDVTLVVPVGGKEGTIVRNVNALLCDAPYFQNYLGMYDQYKINAVRASIEMTYIGNDLLNSQKFPSICTAWDRNGIKVNTVNVAAAQQPAVYKFELPSYDCVTSYSSANEKTIYYGSRWGVVRQLDAASMMEKSMYLPTTNTREVLTQGNMYSAWNPQLLIAMSSAGDGGVVADQSAVFSIHWQFDVTLRGLRKITTEAVMDHFKPNPGYIGYTRDNKGLAVKMPNGNYIVVGAADVVNEPVINPDLNMPNNYIGPVVPNNGTPGANIGI